MRNIEQRNYFSTNDFVGTNNLEEEAEKLFGKGWEAADDVCQIEQLLELVGALHFTVIYQEYVKSGYDLAVHFNSDLKEIADLKKQNKALIERLNANHCAIDSSLESLEEQGFTGLEESDFYLELSGELAPNETLLRSIERETEL